MNKNLPELPASSDEYWESGEINHFTPHNIPVCSHHVKGSTKGEFKDNSDGTVSCLHCPFGLRLGPKMRVIDNKIVVY